MKITQKKLKLIAILMFGLGLTSLQAQESINATGGNASGSNGKVSYSVGQVVYTTNTGTNGSVAEGVQQPYEISVVTGIEEAKDINLLLTAFPNPTNDYLTLEMQSFVQTQDFASQEAQKQYFASLYDLNGKLLQKIPITNQQIRIDMNNLAPATYFLKVTVQTQDFASQEVKTQDLASQKGQKQYFASQEIKTFKIVKR